MRVGLRETFVLVAALGLFGCGTGTPDWPSAAREDVDAIHRLILENHPGPVDPENPGFRDRLEDAHRRAVGYAGQAEDFGGYLYSVRSLTIAFQDAHLQHQLYKTFDRVYTWPGFTVSAEGDELVVVWPEDDDVPPAGARLVACDGRDAETLVAERVSPWIGNWSLRGQRRGDAPFLLVDTGNPFVDELDSCVFEIDGAPRTFALRWRTMTSDTLAAILAELEPRVELETGLRTLDDGTVWISLGSFDVTDAETDATLRQLIDEIENRRSELAAAPALVLDVRGNTGGSSIVAVDVARAIWGAGFVDNVRPRIDRVDWRASADNVAAIDTFMPMIREAYGEDSPTYREMTEVRTGLKQALETGADYFTVDKTSTGSEGGDAAPLPVTATTYLLTDHVCVSACLDFADVVLSIDGVESIGRETSGDTQYLEVRSVPLPSKIGQLTFAVAAHRGRRRADNASYPPVHRWDGDIADTAALEAWIGALARGDGGS